MSWVFGERRGPAWKRGWAEQALASVSAPPLQLLAVFGVVFGLISFKLYIDYVAHVERTVIGFKMVLMLVPLLLVLAMQCADKMEGFAVPYPRWRRPAAARGEGGSPCGVAAVVVVLIVMVSYQSYFHSMWTVWRSDY